MTNPPEKKKNRAMRIGCLAAIFSCLAIVLISILGNWIQSSQNLCDWNSPEGCRNIYRVGSSDTGRSLAISADGRFLAISNVISLMILDTETGRIVASAKTGSDANTSDYPVNVAISPDGKYAAVITNYNAVLLLNAENGNADKIQGGSGFGAGIQYILFSPDGKHLLYSVNYGDIFSNGTLIYRYDIAKKRGEQFMKALGPLDITPHGLIAVAVENGIHLWRYADTPSMVSEIPIDSNGFLHAAISPDEKKIAVSFYLPDSSYYETASQLIDIETGQVLLDNVGSDMAFSPDGKFITYHDCRASFSRIKEDGNLSDYWTELDLLDPIAANLTFSGSPTCSSNVVIDSNSKFMYYGDGGKIGRFDIPEPTGYEIFLESYTPEP